MEVPRTYLSLKSVETAIQKAFFLTNKPIALRYIRTDGSAFDVTTTNELEEAMKDAEISAVQFFQLFVTKKDPTEPAGFIDLPTPPIYFIFF